MLSLVVLAAVTWPTAKELNEMLIATSVGAAGTGLELGMVLPDGRTLVANAGYSCSFPTCIPPKIVGANNEPTNFCFGSATKMLTAVAIMHKVDQKKVELDALAEPLIEAFLQRGKYNVSLRTRLGPEIQNVTVRHLLSMRAGIKDYDGPSRSWQLKNPKTDIDPIMVINKFVEPGFAFAPGTHAMYSTTNYVLLGMVLAALEPNVTKWEDLDQRDILPEEAHFVTDAGHFPKHGTCSEVAYMAHGLTFNGILPVDTWGISCTNGWTGGNWAGPAYSAAQVTQKLFHCEGNHTTGGCTEGGGRLISKNATDEMRNFGKLDFGSFGIGIPYGLGLMDLGSQLVIKKRPVGTYIGHGGETFGFTGFTGFVPSKNVSLAVFANAENVVATMSATSAALSMLGV